MTAPSLAVVRTLVALLVALTPTLGTAFSLFQVGNSFTFDSLAISDAGFSTGPVTPVGTVEMLQNATGESVTLGYHVRGNQTLESLWTNPDASGTFSTGFGRHPVALPENDWDYLTVQTFPALSEPTLGQEVARIQDFVDAADEGSGGDTTIIVYGPWAPRSEGAWSLWHDPVVDDPATLTNNSAAYHDLLFDKVEAANPGRVRLASAGKVIREIRDRILEGDAPFETTDELYRDAVHMSLGGRFVASTAIQTVLLGRSMVGEPIARNVPNWSVDRISDEQAAWVQLVAWEVLLADERAQIATPAAGDYDGNGEINTADFQLWSDTYGSMERLLADGNGNGVIDAADYTLWRDAYESIGGVAVPEPSSVALAALALLLVRRRGV